jgi:plasmid stabilization system protein ParE
MAQITWSNQAVKDLEQIYRFIARDSTVAAELTVERIRDATRRLSLFPKSGRPVSEAPESEAREVITAPFRVIYRLHGGDVQVLTVLHGARDLRPD